LLQIIFFHSVHADVKPGYVTTCATTPYILHYSLTVLR